MKTCLKVLGSLHIVVLVECCCVGKCKSIDRVWRIVLEGGSFGQKVEFEIFGKHALFDLRPQPQDRKIPFTPFGAS